MGILAEAAGVGRGYTDPTHLPNGISTCLVTAATTPSPAASPRGGQDRGPGGCSTTSGHLNPLLGDHHPKVVWGLPHSLLSRTHHQGPWAPWQPLTPTPHSDGPQAEIFLPLASPSSGPTVTCWQGPAAPQHPGTISPAAPSHAHSTKQSSLTGAPLWKPVPRLPATCERRHGSLMLLSDPNPGHSRHTKRPLNC